MEGPIVVEPQEVVPHHDFLGLVGIQHQGILTLYGVVPRFWHGAIPDNLLMLDEKVHARILTQKKVTTLEPSEAKRIQQKIDRIKRQLPSDEVEVESEEVDKKQLEEGQFLSPAAGSEILEKLFHLCEFYFHGKSTQDITESQGLENGGLPFFQFERFVDMLEAKTRELRRTYRTVVEPVSAVRGRITTRGMLMMVAQPSPRIECEYETFDVQAPLYKVMVSTLDVIRSTRLPLGFQFLQKKFDQIVRRGSNLRMKMAEIPSLSLTQALRECTRLNRRLPKSFKAFEDLLPLALAILKREADQLMENKEEQISWHITVPSSKLWELLLEESLRDNSQQWDIEAQEELRGPWHVNTPKNIDLRVKNNVRSNVVLIDAKYGKASPKTPNAGYQYQQFFYAVKWISDPLKRGHLTDVALLHPASTAEEETYNQHAARRGLAQDLRNLMGQNVQFNIWTLPFPQPTYIQDSTLHAYFRVLNPKFRTLLDNCG